jgi:glutamyl-tRNA reductase
MPVIVVGLNHRSSPVDLLERLSIPDEDLSKALHSLVTYEHVLEGAVLSTCNRTEVYALVSKFHGGAQDLRNFLAEFCHIAPEDFVDHLYTYHDDAAVSHLFRVASGIDSMIVGESEILGQVRRAFQHAYDEGAARSVLGTAFRRALRVGKRARTETAIGRNPVSISSAAVDLAKKAFDGDLSGRKVAIIGAGKMGGLTARALVRSGATDVTVVNRTEERAQEVAELLDAKVQTIDALAEVLRTVDIAISSTMASQPLIDRDLAESVVSQRKAKSPLLIVDIAVPRDVEPSVGELDGIVLRDIDALKDVVETGRGGRLAEVAKVEVIIEAELERFLEWERTSDFKPTAAALVAKADEVRAAELERALNKLGTVTDRQRDAIDHLTRRLVAKLLHGPLAKARDASTVKKGYFYVSTLRDLFDLDDEEPLDDIESE